MDKTKKYTILFVIVCFLSIGVAGTFRQPLSVKEEIITDKRQDTKTTENKEKQKEENKKQELTTSKKEENQKENNKQKVKSSRKEENKKQDTVSSKKEEPIINEEKIVKVYVSITDVNGNVISDNISINDKSTAYSVLKDLCEQKGISHSTNGYGKIIYVKEINGLSEFDYGNQSGWKYKVNDVFPNVGAGAFDIKEGDRIEWVYTTTL